MSFVISLTCALLATLLQQWARRYIKLTQPHYSPQKRVRIRAFFFEGVEKLLLPWVVEALPTLLHVSLFLFFAGLVVFLCNVNITIFKLVLSWVGVGTALYGCITFIPVFRHDSPYYTSLSSLVWLIVIGILYVFSQARWWFFLSVRHRHPDIQRFRGPYHKLLLQGMQRTAEETALNSPSEIDTRAFWWTFDRLDEDHELEHFFSGLPGFRSSKVVDDPLPTGSPTSEQKRKVFQALVGLLDRTFSSDLLSEPVKNRRARICAKAIDPAEIPDAYQWIFKRIMSGDQHEGLRTAEFGRIVRGWADRLSGNQDTTLVVQAILTGIVATAQRRNDPWFILASDELGIQESVLRDYAADGDSLSLAILIHVTRQQFSHYRKPWWPKDMFSEILEAASQFNVQDTSPELQREFCALWNQILLKVQNDNDQWMVFRTLGRIRDVYLAFHQDTNSVPTKFFASAYNQVIVLLEPSLYPLCNVPGHHQDSTPHIHDDSSSTTYARVVPHDHDNIALVPSFLPSSPDTPCSSAHAPLCVDASLIVVPPLDDNISVPVSLQPVDQTTTESCRIPATSPNPVTTCMTHGDVDTTAKTTHLSTLGPSASTNPPPESKTRTSTSAPDAVAVLHAALRRTPSDDPDVPSSPSPTLVPDNTSFTGLLLSSASPVTGSDHASSSPGSHLSLQATAPPGQSRPQLSSASGLGAAADGEGSAKAALHKHKERDALDPLSAIRENSTIPLHSSTHMLISKI